MMPLFFDLELFHLTLLCIFFMIQKLFRAGEVAQWVAALATKPNGPSLFPVSPVVEGRAPPTPILHMHIHTHAR